MSKSMQSRWLAVLLLAACGTPSPTKPALDLPLASSPTEAYAPADEPAEPETEEFAAIVTSKQEITLTADFDGRLDTLAVQVGQRVTKDQILAVLDTKELRSRIEVLKHTEASARNRAGASHALGVAAAKKAEGSKRVYNAGAGTMNDVIAAEAERRNLAGTAGADSQQAQASAEEREHLESLVPKANIAAPFDGVVLVVNAKPGHLARKGDVIARVYDPSDLIVKFAVPDEYRDSVAVGDRIKFDANGTVVSATVTEVSLALTPPRSITIVVADINDSKLSSAAIHVASQGKVRLAKRRAPAPTVL